MGGGDSDERIHTTHVCENICNFAGDFIYLCMYNVTSLN